MLYAKKFNPQNTNDSLSKIYSMIDDGSVVLDIGCACGDLSIALAKEKKCRVYGIEANSKSVEFCKKSAVFEKIWHYDLNDFKSEDFYQYRNFFDIIVCADVLEHLIHPEKILSKISPLLKQGKGRMIVSLPNAAHASIKTNLLLNDFTYTEMGILDKTHLHFYTAKSIAELLASAEFKIIKADIVTMPLDGWQPHKLSELPDSVSSFIAADKHSYVMQFITLCEPKKCLAKTNFQILDASVPPLKRKSSSDFKDPFLFRLKRFAVRHLSFLIKYLEYINTLGKRP